MDRKSRRILQIDWIISKLILRKPHKNGKNQLHE